MIKPMLKPFPNYVLIKPDLAEKKTASGILLPEETKDVPQTGTLIDYHENIPFGLKKGIKIWFNKWSEKEIIYKNQKYFAVHYKDLLTYEEK